MEFSEKMIVVPYSNDENINNIIKIAYKLGNLSYNENFYIKYENREISIFELIKIVSSNSEDIDNINTIVDILTKANISPNLINNEKIKQKLNAKGKLYTKKSPIQYKQTDWLIPEDGT